MTQVKLIAVNDFQYVLIEGGRLQDVVFADGRRKVVDVEW